MSERSFKQTLKDRWPVYLAKATGGWGGLELIDNYLPINLVGIGGAAGWVGVTLYYDMQEPSAGLDPFWEKTQFRVRERVRNLYDRVRNMGNEEIYEGPISDLIGLALHKDAVQHIAEGESIDDLEAERSAIEYIERILSEEVEKQFADRNRPFVELISNAIDARPVDEQEEYVVEIDTYPLTFEVSDRGKSMDLQDLLQTLMIPFSTDKDKMEDLGRFGVGFYSNLSYCLEHPGATKVVVDTNNGESAYRTTFWSETGNAEDLQVRIEPGRKRKEGTTVSLRGVEIHKYIDRYLESYLGYFDPERAVIQKNGTVLNPLPEGDTIKETVDLDIDDHTVSQPLRFTINLEDDSGIKQYSQGIYIQGTSHAEGTLHLSLPSAVKVVEGRNEFKMDDNYRHAIDQFYDMLIDYAEENVREPEQKDTLSKMIPQVEKQFDHPFSNHKEPLADVLFPEDTYLLSHSRPTDNTLGPTDNTILQSDYDAAQHFFGDQIDAKIVSAPQSTCNFWEEHVPGLEELVEDYAQLVGRVDATYIPQILAERGMESRASQSTVHTDQDLLLVELDTDTYGSSPFLRTGDTIYVNVNHPFLQEETSASNYGLKVEFIRAKNRGEKDIEGWMK